jgi:hypothetical protein
MSLGIPLNPISFFTGLASAQNPSRAASASTASSTASSAASSSASANSVLANLNLTSTEASQISAILNGSQGQSFAQLANRIDTVLTPSQQKTFASNLQSLQSHHGHHHGGGGGSGSSSTIDSGTDAFGVSSITNASPATTAASSLFSDLAAQFSAQSQTQSQTQLLDL